LEIVLRKEETVRWTSLKTHSLQVLKVAPCTSLEEKECGSVAQWFRALNFSEPLHCRLQLWTSCSHTQSSASGVTTLWRYIKIKQKQI